MSTASPHSLTASLTPSLTASLTPSLTTSCAVRRAGVLPALCIGGLVIAGLAIVSKVAGVRRFVVADRSMEPTLCDGQGLIGVLATSPAPGQLRTFEHPDRSGFWLVKRVVAVDGGSMIVESDNRDIATVDSNTFGPVPSAGSYRVVARVPVRWM